MSDPNPCYSEQFVLPILPAAPSAPSVASNTFPIPSGFVGHVYLHGMGGDQQAIFRVGTDGNGRIIGGGGFVALEAQNQLPNVQLQQAGTRQLQFIGLTYTPGAVEVVYVAIVGAYLSS